MFQAEIHLQQEKSCVLSDFAEYFDTSFDVDIEELHDHRVTFTIRMEEPCEEYIEFFEDAEQVDHIERLDEANYLITKTSCGAYSAVDRNHGVLRRQSHVFADRRVYTVLFFRREDLRAMIDDFNQIGTVTLGKLTEFEESKSMLTDRQLEVVTCALEEGYFEWPRGISSEELADELGINRTTALEHLRKAQSKLLTSAIKENNHLKGHGEP
ncbi:helix-turn-helix domain-containing protein [Haloterrigena alkaliphila]|uniref:helix-turn-helix domain-containing protein n=1 Tax=Haloterrigena alkaliphila TaxID=2816475 RepID=UPI001CFF7584|nr:helix-turn-helix domain-containing protein [Haloterrigena alkaliphila]UHQ95072.1 helix-turn-helix domain-containing protein [Haloterrigena alkaliphila]